jgi:hypothetical protein
VQILDQDGKQDIGLAEHGDNMKINEVDKELEKFKDVDWVDDLKFFMHNDPRFYRTVVYPVIAELKSKLKSGSKCNEMSFMPCIDKAIPSYCNKFKITQNPKKIFDDEEIKDLAVKMFHEEKSNIEKGVYDRSDK